MLAAEIRDGRCQTLARMSCHENFDPVLMGVDVQKLPLLGSIDPYGDTVFNYLQVERILIEFRDYQLIERGFEVSVRRLEEFSRQALAKPHRFLWFIGD